MTQDSGLLDFLLAGLAERQRRGNASNGYLAALLGPPRLVKPRLFLSYHHRLDQWYADRFISLFDDRYDLITDRSLDCPIESDDPDYISRRIRDEFISYTSCTIVLCGIETPNRKHVDWEIKATLDKNHALLGIVLPSHQPTQFGRYLVPDRLFDNINSGFSRLIHWTENPSQLVQEIAAARNRAGNTRLIRNSRAMMSRNR